MKIKKGRSAYDAALDYLTSKDRTQREIENYLDEGNYSEVEISNTIIRLANAGFVNDTNYAQNFVDSRLNTKPVSRRKLRQQLESHFVPDEIIDAALESVSDEVEMQNALAVAEKFYRQFASLDEPERLKRVGLRLSARNYDYDCIKSVLEKIKDDN